MLMQKIIAKSQSHTKNKESKKQLVGMNLSVIICLSWWKGINKKEKNFSHLVYNTVGLSKVVGKAEPFSWR